MIIRKKTYESAIKINFVVNLEATTKWRVNVYVICKTA